MSLNLMPELPSLESDRQGSDFFTFPVQPTSSITEEFFGSLGPMSCANGWAVIPQERTGKRLPGKYNLETIKWGLYTETAPSPELVTAWARAHFSTNIAVILGPSSGNTFALDVDVSDLELCLAIEDAAFEHLGHTEFRRIGNDPKRALLYRVEREEDLPRKRQMILLDEAGEQPSGHAVEILGAKSMLTVYGRHHKTLRNFSWAGNGQPASHDVSSVPVVTPAQLEAFCEALHAIRQIKGGPKAKAASDAYGIEIDVTATKHVRGVRIDADRGGEWTVNGDGRVEDGRENFLRYVTHRLVVSNPGAALTDEGRAELKAVAIATFAEKALMSGRWTESRVRSEVDQKIGALVGKVERGEIKQKVRGSSFGSRPARPEVLEPFRTYGDAAGRGTEWLSAIRSPRQDFRGLLFEGTAMPEIPESLRIAESPKQASDAISHAVTTQIGGFIEEARVYDATVAMEDKRLDFCGLTRLVTAPTGAGKTIRILDALVASRTDEPWPVLMLLPSYKNVEEVEAEAIARGLNVMVFRGKVRTGKPVVENGPMPFEDGCKRWADVEKLQSAGKSSAGLCEATDPHDPENVLRCPFYDNCLYQKQKEQIAQSDLVLAVHNYITVSIPKALQECRMVIVDESIRSQLLRSHTIPDTILEHPRGLAFLTKKEREAGVSGEEMFEDRAELVRGVLPIIRRNGDPTDFIRKHKRGAELLKSTLALCSRTRDATTVTPRMSSQGVDEHCSIATELEIRAEHRFWKIIEERLAFREADEPSKPHRSMGLKPNREKVAKGKKDIRIHWVRGKRVDGPGEIRLSWIVEANFQDRPMLLLDASANRRIMERALQRPLDHDPIDAPRRIRFVHVHGHSLSKTSLLPKPTDTPERLMERARTLAEVRIEITAICAMHAGGVVGCAPMAVEELILNGWAPPSNFVMLHYGATRGLNFASGYDAAIAIGCINPSAEQIDSDVAALTYAHDDQEEMVDAAGENRLASDAPEGWEYREARIPMRNGSVLVVNQRSCKGSLAQIVYDQVRREELMQFIGRLRPIHRVDIPTVYNLGSYVPEGVIVDEVVLQSDLIRFGQSLEASRRHQLPIAVDNGTDVLDEEIVAGEAMEAIAETTPAVSRNFIHVRIAGQIRYAPVYVSDAIDKMVAEGDAEIVYSPDRTPIIRPIGWDADKEIYVRRDAEHAKWSEGIRFAAQAGWTQDAPGGPVRNPAITQHPVGLALAIEMLKREIPGLQEQMAEEERQAQWLVDEMELLATERSMLLHDHDHDHEPELEVAVIEKPAPSRGRHWTGVEETRDGYIGW